MRQVILLVAAVVVLGTVAGLPVVTATENVSAPGIDSAVQAQSVNDSNSVAPGERLSGVVGVQQAEFEGEFERRTFGAKIASAATNTSKAGVVKAQLERTQERLNQLQTEKQRLQAARENGSISEGRYQAEIARLAARTQTVNQLANDTENQTRRLPRAALEEKGVNQTAIDRLRREAQNLSGPEVAAIARSIAGRNVGPRASGGPPTNVGPPGDRGPPERSGPGDDNETAPADNENQSAEAEQALDRAERRVENARTQVDRAQREVNESNASADALDSLESAKAELTAAESALAEAHDAHDAGRSDEAIELAEEAVEHAESATADARDALAASGPGDGAEQDGDGERGSQNDGEGTDNDSSNQGDDGYGNQ